MMKKRGNAGFEECAIENGVFTGVHTLNELHSLYVKHKGSRWKKILELFKAKGELLRLDEFIKDCITK